MEITPEEFELLGKGDGNVSFSNDFPLHYLARVGDHDQLKTYLNFNPEQAAKEIQRLDFYVRTPLHYVALTDNLTGGEQCVKELLDFYQTLKHSSDSDTNQKFRRMTSREKRILIKKDGIGEKTQAFINWKDHNGETALSLAARNENPNVVQILLAKSANVLTKSRSGQQALELIYSNTPSAVIALLNQSVFFDYGNQSYDLTEVERSYSLDLSPIVGESENFDDPDLSRRVSKEVDLLHSVNNKGVRARGEILKHPLVQIFLQKKTEKFKFFTWFVIYFHLVWLGLYNWIVITVYYNYRECKLDPMKCNLMKNSSANATTVLDGEVPAYNIRIGMGRVTAVFIFSMLIVIKEVYKMVFLKRVYLKGKNLIVWGFIIILILTTKPHLTDLNFFMLQLKLSTFGVVISGLIVIELVHKHVYFAIYIKVLLKVFNRFLAILPIFIFIMVIFAVSLRMHFPDVHAPLDSLENFRNSIMLMFEVITGGKIEWNGKYKESINNNYRLSGFIIYIGFYVIITLLLFKILTGFVVADTKKMQEQEVINSISDDLEEIFLYESFLLSKTYDFLARQTCCNCLNSFREHFLLCRNEGGNRTLKIKVMEMEIQSHDLRKSIRLLASKNTAKLKMPEFLKRKESIVIVPKKKRFSRLSKFFARRNTNTTKVSPLMKTA